MLNHLPLYFDYCWFLYLVLTDSLCGCQKKAALTFLRIGLQEVTAQRPQQRYWSIQCQQGWRDLPGESTGCARRIWASQPISPADIGSTALPEKERKRPFATGFFFFKSSDKIEICILASTHLQTFTDFEKFWLFSYWFPPTSFDWSTNRESRPTPLVEAMLKC